MLATVRYAPVCALVAAEVLMPGAASAGDIARHAVLGFGPDGKTFAFEEYGVQDGSGFPYSSIYVIDTDTDSWVSDTPVRVLLEDETAPLAAARTQAHREVAPILQHYGVTEPAIALAANPLGEYTADPVSVSFGQPFPTTPMKTPTRRFTAALEVFDATTPERDCETYIGGMPKGFRLTITNRESTTVAVLHQDGQTIPGSRGCPITYRISEISVRDFYPARKVAVILSVFRPGFEGPDRRFIAVTGTLPE